MKKSRLLALVVVPLLLSGCGVVDPSSSSAVEPSSSEPTSSSSQEPEGIVKKNIEVTMVSHFGEVLGEDEFTDTVLYDDHFFLEDSKTKNYGLALMSVFADGASYSNHLDNNGFKITSYLSEAGYSKIQKNEYFRQGVKLEESIGTIIGQKTIHDYDGKAYTLLAIFPRNAGYGAEWAGNFNMGKAGIHQGFLEARDEMLRFTKSYIDTNKVAGELKVWCAGYSRGAAVANLFGGYLAEDTTYLGDKVSLSPSNLYVYTIGTPRNIPASVSKAEVLSVSGPREDKEYALDTNVQAYEYKGEGTINPEDNKYKCIHNFVAAGDYITKLPPKSWSFTRYGEVEEVVYGGEAFTTLLEKYSPDTAAKFEDKNYTTKLPTSTLDLVNFDIKQTETKISPDEMIEGSINTLMSLAEGRGEMVDLGYTDLLAAATSIFGLDGQGFYSKITKAGISGLARVGILSYLAYAIESLDKSDAEGLEAITMDIMELAGKTVDRENYTDQQFLSDLLDFLINDKEAENRAKKLATLLPEPYSNLYTGLLKCAKDHSLTPRTVDGLLELIGLHVHENRTDKGVQGLIELFAGVFPDDYIVMLGGVTNKTYDEKQYESKAAMKRVAIADALECFGIGNFEEDGKTQYKTAAVVRYTVLSLANLYLAYLSPVKAPKLASLLMNGAVDEETPVVKDPIKLSDTIAEVLTLAMPKEDKQQLTIKQATNKYLVELLETGKNEAIAKYVEALEAKPDDVRNILVTVLFQPGETYSLKNDVDNAITFVDMIQFLFPAHNHEMYMCYIKTKISA